MIRPTRHLALLFAFVCTLAVTPIVRAQDGGQGVRATELELSVLNTGVGSFLRAGDWFGLRVQMLDRSREQREIILRVSFTDMDGDEAQYDRVVSANPGVAQSFWLYAWMPFSGPSNGIEIRAYEARDPSSDARGQLAYRPGALLANLNIFNPPLQPPRVGGIGVVGASTLGLEGYTASVDGRGWRPQAHEIQRVMRGLETTSLPDRVQGLVALDTIVWSNATLREHDPSTLTPERARALIDWVRMGGHLVVVLPAADDPWYRGTHPLQDILPKVRVSRRDGVDYETLRPLLTESSLTPLPSAATLHVFEPSDPSVTTVLSSPKGDAVAVRTLVGSGAVTVLGIDLNNAELRRLGLADPESLWHRVLGMRGASPRADEMSDQELADARQRNVLSYDTTIPSEIAKTGYAVQGVLFGLTLFIVYWLIAGPAGFYLLKMRQKHQHAWVGFVALIVVFTLVSWIGATWMRPQRVDAKHLTLFEQVHGQSTARARSWMGVMLPSYGVSEISVGDDTQGVSLVAPWEPSVLSGSIVSGFPDNTGYRIESRDPDTLRVPSRATVKQLRVDWSGDPSWGGVRIVGQELGVEPALEWAGRAVVGSLVHDYPGALTDVLVIVVNRQIPVREPGVPLNDTLIAQASVWSPVLPDRRWEPGEALNLAAVTTPSVGNVGDARSFLEDAVRDGIDPLSIGGRSGGSLFERLTAVRLLSQLAPPDYSTTNRGTGSRLATRRETHGWDLGRWFTQPCVIVVGMLKTDDPSVDAIHAPVLVDGNEVPMSGQTMITWVYPMGSSPPTYPWIAPPVDDED